MHSCLKFWEILKDSKKVLKGFERLWEIIKRFLNILMDSYVFWKILNNHERFQKIPQISKHFKKILNPISHELWNDVITLGGPLWPGWILAILKLSVGILEPEIDFHPIFLILTVHRNQKQQFLIYSFGLAGCWKKVAKIEILYAKIGQKSNF